MRLSAAVCLALAGTAALAAPAPRGTGTRTDPSILRIDGPDVYVDLGRSGGADGWRRWPCDCPQGEAPRVQEGDHGDWRGQAPHRSSRREHDTPSEVKRSSPRSWAIIVVERPTRTWRGTGAASTKRGPGGYAGEEEAG